MVAGQALPASSGDLYGGDAIAPQTPPLVGGRRSRQGCSGLIYLDLSRGRLRPVGVFGLRGKGVIEEVESTKGVVISRLLINLRGRGDADRNRHREQGAPTARNGSGANLTTWVRSPRNSALFHQRARVKGSKAQGSLVRTRKANRTVKRIAQDFHKQTLSVEIIFAKKHNNDNAALVVEFTCHS